MAGVCAPFISKEHLAIVIITVQIGWCFILSYIDSFKLQHVEDVHWFATYLSCVRNKVSHHRKQHVSLKQMHLMKRMAWCNVPRFGRVKGMTFGISCDFKFTSFSVIIIAGLACKSYKSVSSWSSPRSSRTGAKCCAKWTESARQEFDHVVHRQSVPSENDKWFHHLGNELVGFPAYVLEENNFPEWIIREFNFDPTHQEEIQSYPNYQ